MKIAIHFIVILLCLILTYFTYDKQLGAVSFLLLAIYLFAYGYYRLRLEKKKN
ncbi:hypothetical protein [Rummeliibacillus stabekisii]|uniref:hypothetical protein n=1 Tax=Rummeliibacillus stabekisii TaxID=241244 RepID=UPI0011697946|nr:hypothetical protein [Rummeliibacillus stabekisii]MBB5170520.1 prolipoprotein diacylglyceryltransferase [Rummeliibacillus stabekisii]GEL04774.1 hypothetical protein RST01_14010 [Rummeliibacillus stabekisii]